MTCTPCCTTHSRTPPATRTLVRHARLDAELVRRGLAKSRDHAVELVASGAVLVEGQRATKPSTAVDEHASLRIEPHAPHFASRGGDKLAGAIDAFGGLSIAGRRCLDAGASTGGFGFAFEVARSMSDLARAGSFVCNNSPMPR